MVDKKRQKRVEAVFLRACHVPEDRLDDFLDEVCGDDAELGAAVEQMLAAYRQLRPSPPEMKGPVADRAVDDARQDDVAGSAAGSGEEDAADRNLLYGIVALQMNLIDHDSFFRAVKSWVQNKAVPIEQILIAQGDLQKSSAALLHALVRKHLEFHGHRPDRSLAALSSVTDVRKVLETVQDPDLVRSVQHLQSNGRPSRISHSMALGSLSETGGRFRLLRPHKRGGLGAVHVALDQELNREVALKEVREDYAENQSARDRLQIEAEITGGLEHPGIVPVYGLGQYDDGKPFYCMRFIKGDSLKDAIRKYHESKATYTDSARNMELRSLLRRFIDVCDAVGYAHGRRVLHRDLKPGNIMLGKYGETLVVDWGLAKATATGAVSQPEQEEMRTELPIVPRSGSTAAPTVAGAAIGTPEYMSPEQAQGLLDQLGPATDVYSLGATLYCLLTGRPPIVARETSGKIEKAIAGDFPPPRQIDRSIAKPLEAICLRAMARNPADRYPSPGDLSHDLERWLADEPVHAFHDPLLSRFGRLLRKNRAVAWSLIAMAVTAIAGLIAINWITETKNREISNKANIIDSQNARLQISNEQLTAAEKEARNRYEAARGLAFDLIEKSEEELSQQRGMEDLRKWLTDQALATFVVFHDQTPDEPDLRKDLGQLYIYSANLDRFRSQMVDALPKYQKADELLKKIADSQQEDLAVRDLRAELLRDWASVLRDTGDLESARDQLKTAGQLIAKLRRDEPENFDYLRTAGINAMELGLVLRDLDQRAESIRQAEEGSALLRELADNQSHRPIDELLVLLADHSEGGSCRDFNRLEQAHGVLSEAKAFAEERLPDHTSLGAQHVHALILLELALVRNDQARPADQIKPLLESAIANWEQVMAKSTAPRYRRYSNWASVLQAYQEIRLGDEPGGKESLTQALSELRALQTDQSDDVSALEIFAEISLLASAAYRDLDEAALASDQQKQARIFLERAVNLSPCNKRLQSRLSSMK